MKISIGKHSGFCPGVKRAIRMLDTEIDKYKNDSSINIYTLGEIIHNPKVIDSYLKKGVKILKDTDIIGINDKVVIRSHGVSPKIRENLLKNNIKIVDATCPFVLRVHELAYKLSRNGYFIVIVGDPNHPEVMGILGNIDGGDFIVAKDKKSLEHIKNKKKLAVISQTTQSLDLFYSISKELLGKFDEEIRIFKSICKTTNLRQKDAIEMARQNNIVIVVGGKMSANTNHLFELSASIQQHTYHIEDSSELKKDWFHDAEEKIAIISGASTPFSDLEDVRKKIESYFRT